MTYDASNRKDVRKAEKAAKQSEAARIEYTRRIMSESQGREWMYKLLARCSLFHTPFVRGSIDGTAFNCGSQNVGLQLFADVITHCPTQYVLMMQETSHKELTNERHDSDQRSTSGELERGADTRRDNEGPVTSEYDPFEGDPTREDA